MMWRQSCRLKLFLLLGLPAACFGQTADSGSNTASNALNLYAPPCISQVKQYIAVNCQIYTDGGRTTIHLCLYRGLPSWHIHVYWFRRWFDQRHAHRDHWRTGRRDHNRCEREYRHNFLHHHAGRFNLARARVAAASA